MAKKDPAFLLYSEKWLQGTASLMPEEKGVFIDLLCHQHQDGSLPNDTRRLARMAGLSESEFLPIWSTLRSKFVETTNNRLVNRKMNEVVTERLTKGRTNKIIGCFAAVVRLSKFEPDLKEIVKKEFKYEDFLDIPDEELTDRLTEWFVGRCQFGAKSIINIDIDNTLADKEANGIENEEESGISDEERLAAAREKSPKQFPVPSDFNGLPDMKMGAAIQYLRVAKKTDASNDDVVAIWELFKQKHLTGKKFYPNEEEVYSHFLQSLKYEKFDSNETHKRSNSAKSIGNKKSEGFQLLADSLKEDMGFATRG